MKSMDNTKKITIERTTERGYLVEVHEYPEALKILNTELEAKRTIFIDGKPWFGDFIAEKDLDTCKKEISVTNQLIGG
jgi:hypothetical protein